MYLALHPYKSAKENKVGINIWICQGGNQIKAKGPQTVGFAAKETIIGYYEVDWITEMWIRHNQWQAKSLLLETYWFAQRPMHAGGILQSLDESRYRCIMAGNKEMSQKERRTKTSFFVFILLMLNWGEPRKLLSVAKPAIL